MGNAQLGRLIFDDISSYISTVTDVNIEDPAQEISYHGVARSQEEHMILLRAYLKFLKCSYWLPANQPHYVTPDLVFVLTGNVGRDVLLDECIQDTLSALLSLLAHPSVVILEVEALPETWKRLDPATKQLTLASGVLSDSFFNCLNRLSSDYFSGSICKTFRTWFQWISYMATNAVESEVLCSPEYWSSLQTGLLLGTTDQRKYCLGIIQQTLPLCQKSFETPGMRLDIGKQGTTVEQYKKYCTLFEIIVLDRYPNQVQACLPELTTLLGPTSLIHPVWVTALLSAALNPKIQDGVRKPVGNWYLGYANNQPGSCVAHTNFLLEGLLPWATQGSLFTSSLVSTRVTTTCSHGEAVVETISRLVVAASKASAAQGKDMVRAVLRCIVETEGKIFAPAVIYLLEGLLKGMNEEPVMQLEGSDLDMLSRISRLPAMPEITAELCRIYCAEISKRGRPFDSAENLLPVPSVLGDSLTRVKSDRKEQFPNQSSSLPTNNNTFDNVPTLGDFLGELDRTQHKIIQNDAFAPACAHITDILNSEDLDLFRPSELIQLLDAFWEEADRQDYPRPVAIRLARLFFHPTIIRVACQQQQNGSDNEGEIQTMLAKVLTSLHRFAEGRTYLLSELAVSLRKAISLEPRAASVLPLENFFVRLVENPPVPKKEFLFEVVAAEKLERFMTRLNSGIPIADRNYEAYYGQREWMGYAAIIDLINRFPETQVHVVKRVMDRLLEPWRTQKAPIPIISKSKNVLQLQIMLVLTESCLSEENAEWYLDSFMHALILEPWPRYRYLLEWTIARIYFHFPNKAHCILDNLEKLDENSPVQVASLMKLALLTAPLLDSEDFALKLTVLLIPFSASPKIHIRHEAHWCFPTIFDLAKGRQWSSITSNPAFVALDKHIRALDKFSAQPTTIRTLKLDAVKDFTLTNIFQGQYLRIETPDMEYVAHDDFLELHSSDAASKLQEQYRVPLGDIPPSRTFNIPSTEDKKEVSSSTTQSSATDVNSTFFQTKSGFDVASLLPSAGPPSAQITRPASVILIASLIDNPTNLGGLSRISESFGLEALYIDDLKKVAHKDFKATSVTSEKHFPIRELKAQSIPAFLIDLKRKGYEVVGIEQTDRSGLLGEESALADTGKDIGTLPEKCVLVLGAERSGISSEVLAVVDRCVEIKTVGVTRSLNVQTAGAVAVYEWWREWGSKI